MLSGRGAGSGNRTRRAGDGKRTGPKRSSGFRLSLSRQAFFVGLALAGIATGYGIGYLFKGQPPTPVPAAGESRAAPQKAALPLLPENAKPARQVPVRAYEEALPKTIVENHAAIQPTDSGASKPEQTESAAKEPTPPAAAVTAPETPGATPSSTDSVSPAPETASAPITAPPVRDLQPPGVRPAPANLPAWRKFAVAVPASEGRPRIAVVIDDLGIDKPRTKRAIHLRPPLTLSFLTYASGLKELTAAARAAGHELLMHIPMEPGSQDVDPGPNVLLTGIPRRELDANLRWNLDQFDGYVGINNHMGSRFTADMPGMLTVMEELKRRKLLFLDSITAGNSVAGAAARRVGVPYARRNVFIDHEDKVESVKRQLVEVERLARRTGAAVAIGHPREVTLNALVPWLDEIEKKGFQLVPISAITAGDPSSRG